MVIYLVPNTKKPEALPVTSAAINILAREGADLLIDPIFMDKLDSSVLPKPMAKQAALECCDILLTIGGDGTILHAAKQTMKWQKPMIGINTGHLGFLALIESDELEQLKLLVSGDYTVENRSVLQISQADGACIGLALNDIVLYKTSDGKPISLDICCDEILVSSFCGDGVIFATPTGSTAYSMSAGGPIVDARLESIIVTQICAHIVRTPPMVFDSKRVLQVSSRADELEGICLSCDGDANCSLLLKEPVRIHQSEYTVPLIQISDADQLKSIDKKLKGR